VFGFAVTGHGDKGMAAPVRFTRKNTTRMLCETVRTAACSHVSLTRHFMRNAEPREQSAAATQAKGTEMGEYGEPATGADVAFSEADVAQSVSQKPMGLFICHKATRTDKEIGELVGMGSTYRVLAPVTCPKCKQDRGSAPDVGSDGVILPTAGPCRMRLDADLCPYDTCGEWVSADGCAQGVVIYAPRTAASAVLMCQWAFALALDSTMHASSIEARRWSYFDRRDAGTATTCRIRARQTINRVFNAAVRLMTEDPPIWCFSCSTCKDADGRFRVVTAEGIWLGFLRRLASKL